MTSRDALWKIHFHWAAKFDCAVEALLQPRTAVVPYKPQDNWSGAFFLRHASSTILAVPRSHLDRVRTQLNGTGTTDLFTPQYVKTLFGDQIEEIVGPAWLGYADRTDFRAIPAHGVRRLTAADAEALHALAEACGAEWELSGIEFDQPLLQGCFVDGELTAAGTLTTSSATVLNIGIITHPRHRGQGYGKRVVSALTTAGLVQECVLQYRTLESNEPSMAIARDLGFQQYGITIAVRLRASSP
jgi:GNAT superfamily N-acetyltransferase